MIMKNEIKEILDRLFVYKNENDEMKYQPEDILTIDDVWLLLDCITNLQQIEQDHQKLNGELREENKKLQEEIERQSKAQVILDNQITEMYDYKSRNEKALEYIKRFENQPWYVEGCQIKDLKSLLQGDDKE